MSATEQNYQGLEGRDHNPQQPDGALRGRKPRQGKFGPRAKSGGSRHQEGERQDRRQEQASHDEPREGRGRRGGSFNHRRPGGEAFGRGEQRDHGERGPRSARDERGFSRNERSYSHKDRRDHRDEGASFERARNREAHDRDARDADFEGRFDRRERFAPKREHFVKDKGDFSRGSEGDGGKRNRFASERHDRPARGAWHGRNDREDRERADERRDSREGRTNLQPRARFSERFPARPGERREGFGDRGERRGFGEKAGQGRDARGTGPRPDKFHRTDRREQLDGYVSGRDDSVQTKAGAAYALARTPEDFVRPGEWGYEAEDRSRKAMLKERSGLTDVIILGAGAAGLMCAAHLVDLGLSVCVLDRSRTPARKLAIAGGGHANFSNRNLSPSHYVCGQEGFVAPVLEKMGTNAMVRTMELLGMGYEEREKGKLFLTGTGVDLARALLARCRKGDFTLLLGEHLREDCVRPEAERIMVRSQGARLAARHVVLALGSPACPASGATGLGYAMAQHLGHSVITPRAALTPLTLPETSPWLALSGVSLPVKLTVCDKTISDDMLFTRTGLSGPAILKASLYWKEGEALEIDLLPHELHGLFGDENGKRTPRSVLSRLMPQRLADLVLPESLANRRCAELSREMREELEERVHALKILPSSRAGLRQAEVCMGGVDCAEIEPVTFASKLENRVSIIGEMLDVTGHLGGYNLHWAFASALLCADAVANSLYRLRRG